MLEIVRLVLCAAVAGVLAYVTWQIARLIPDRPPRARGRISRPTKWAIPWDNREIATLPRRKPETPVEAVLELKRTAAANVSREEFPTVRDYPALKEETGVDFESDDRHGQGS